MLEGFDVSAHNPPDLAPWHRAAFGFARISHGRGLDKSAPAHLARMADHGVERGGYHYLRGDSPGYEQAEVFWDAVCDLGGGSSFALALDLEHLPPPAPPWDRKVYGQRGADFLERLRHLSGRPCGVYGSPGYLATLALPAALAGPLWAAHWGVATPLVVPPWSEATIHQYAVIDGLDRNRFRGTRADFRRAFGLEVLTPTDEQLGALAGRVRRAEGRGDTAETFVAIDEGPVIPGGA